jgi:hypothetical protein
MHRVILLALPSGMRLVIWPFLIAGIAVAPAASQVLRSRPGAASMTIQQRSDACPACGLPPRVARRPVTPVVFCPRCDRSWWARGRVLHPIEGARLEPLARS